MSACTIMSNDWFGLASPLRSPLPISIAGPFYICIINVDIKDIKGRERGSLSPAKPRNFAPKRSFAPLKKRGKFIRGRKKIFAGFQSIGCVYLNLMRPLAYNPCVYFFFSLLFFSYGTISKLKHFAFQFVVNFN